MISKFLILITFLAVSFSEVSAEAVKVSPISCPSPNISALIFRGAIEINLQELEKSPVKDYLIEHHAYERVQETLETGKWMNISMRSESGENGLIVSVQNNSLWYLWTADAEVAKLKLKPGYIQESSSFFCENAEMFKGKSTIKEKDAI